MAENWKSTIASVEELKKNCIYVPHFDSSLSEEGNKSRTDRLRQRPHTERNETKKNPRNHIHILWRRNNGNGKIAG